MSDDDRTTWRDFWRDDWPFVWRFAALAAVWWPWEGAKALGRKLRGG